MRRTWQGLDSIEVGDKLKYELPSGATVEVEVAKPIAIITTPSAGRALRFYSERIRIPNTTIDFASFERVVAEEWITHWRGRRIRSSRSGREIQGVDSSQTKGMGRQIPFPIQEGA